MIIAIFKKEILQLHRDPRLVALIIIMPIILLVLFGVALKLEPKNVKMAFLDEDHSYFSNLIKTSLWSDGYFDLYEVETKQAIVAEIRSGRAKAGMYISGSFSAELIENQQPSVIFYADGTMPSLTTALKYNAKVATDEKVTSAMYFSDIDSDEVVIAQEPFLMETVILFNPDEKETWFFLPGVIGVLIMQIALILTGICIVREKEKHTLEQLFVTPISRSALIIGKLLPYIFIGLFDFYFILAIGWLLFDLPQPSSQLHLFLLAVIYVAAMISLGLFISLISQTQQQAMFIAIFIIIPSILLSGFIFPLEAIPEDIRGISYAIPFTYFVDIIRGLLIKNTLLDDLKLSYLALTSFSLVFIILSIYLLNKKQ